MKRLAVLVLSLAMGLGVWAEAEAYSVVAGLPKWMRMETFEDGDFRSVRDAEAPVAWSTSVHPFRHRVVTVVNHRNGEQLFVKTELTNGELRTAWKVVTQRPFSVIEGGDG